MGGGGGGWRWGVEGGGQLPVKISSICQLSSKWLLIIN